MPQGDKNQTSSESSDNKEIEDKNKMEEEEAKKIVESITDSITSGEKKDIEESTRDIVKKAALAVGSLKETEFDIRYVIFQQNFLLTIRWYFKINNKQSNVSLIMISHL